MFPFFDNWALTPYTTSLRRCWSHSAISEKYKALPQAEEKSKLKSNKEIWAYEYQGEGDVDLVESTAELKLDGKLVHFRKQDKQRLRVQCEDQYWKSKIIELANPQDK